MDKTRRDVWPKLNKLSHCLITAFLEILATCLSCVACVGLFSLTCFGLSCTPKSCTVNTCQRRGSARKLFSKLEKD
jgi:hypothetical protein